MKQRPKHLQERHHASCIVEVVHIVISTRFEINQQWGFASDLFKGVQSDYSLKLWVPIGNGQ